ncbi:hypothetical protein KAR91_60295 [Candidatus Pacearchaeota archaeon]|nr:hypothetical protein [Candidatus Pacearchaeota archaeon]
MGKDCTTCKYGSWGFSKLYPEECEKRCNKCSGLFNEWVRKEINDERWDYR